MSKINIAFAVNDNYVDYLGTTIYSILKNNPKNKFHFVILSSDISKRSKKELEILKNLSKDADFEFIKIDRSQIEKIPITVEHISKETYFRYLLPELLPNLKKIVYLDSDLVVLNDIKDFWNTDISDYYLAGANETDATIRFPENKEKIGFKAKEFYINAGVLLLNLEKMRKDKISQKLFDITLDENQILPMQDQDAINIVCRGKIKELSNIYNYTDQNRIDGINKDEEIVIHHYNGPNKPWDEFAYFPDDLNKYADIYRKYLKEYEKFIVENDKTPKKTVLKVSNITKSFKLPTEQSNGIKQAFINWTKGIKGYKNQEVLRGISFEVKEGDFLGIVGRNGSGKSTLLKMISQIYFPDSGKIEVKGRLIPFIELGVGFNPELTGRENIYLNGALLGFSHKEVGEMYSEIVDFAELHDFMDQKLKNYSSGMQVRLAFSIAIKARGDILVLDEVLAVGDEAFQRKCNEFFVQQKRQGKTIILVTHSMGAVRRYCNKAILISEGKIIESGDPDKVATAYSELFK